METVSPTPSLHVFSSPTPARGRGSGLTGRDRVLVFFNYSTAISPWPEGVFVAEGLHLANSGRVFLFALQLVLITELGDRLV